MANLRGTPPSVTKISNLSPTQRILEKVLLANILDIPLSEMFASAAEDTGYYGLPSRKPSGVIRQQVAGGYEDVPASYSEPRGSSMPFGPGLNYEAWRDWQEQQKAKTYGVDQKQKAIFDRYHPNRSDNPLASQSTTTGGGLGDRLDSGGVDDYIKRKVYQGDRVADLTPEQLAILSRLPGLNQQTTAPNVPMEGYNQILAGRGLPAQTVGEQGPEVITAKEDMQVLPRKFAPSRELFSNPLAVEENQVGANPNALMKRRGLRGYAGGGHLRKGQKGVVGEYGTESLITDTQRAAQKALSGEPSTTVLEDTTEKYINQSVAAPLLREYEQYTNPLIKSAYAGPGYWSSARAGARGAAENVGAQIGQIGSGIRYQDEQARRGLAESAADRQLSAIPAGLSVMAHPLMMNNLQAQTEATKFGTRRGQTLLGGEVGQQQANIGATRAGTEATKFGVQRGEKLLPGEVGGQQAATEAMQFETQRGRELLPAELAQMAAGIQQILAGVGLTEANTGRLQGLIAQDMAQTGMIQAETERVMQSMGMVDAQIEQVKSQTAQMDADLMRAPLDYQQQQQQVIGQQIANLNNQMNLAGVEQAQNQAELDAELAKFLEGNEAAFALFQQLMALFSEPTQTAIVDPGMEGMVAGMGGMGGGMYRQPQHPLLEGGGNTNQPTPGRPNPLM